MKKLIFLVSLCVVVQSKAEDLSSPARLHVGGFADAVLHSTADNRPRYLSEIDIYTTLRLSDAWLILAEGVAERSWGPPTRTETSAFQADLERWYLAYRTSDTFQLEIGQTHTGIIRWNEREHRSRFLQTPIDVPAIARRPEEDGAWPLRFVGVWASGHAPGRLGLTWEGGAGAGPGTERDAIPIFSQDRSPAGFFSLSVAPQSIPGFDVGLAVYAQHVPTKPDALRERDLTLSSNYINSGTEVRVEWARMDHRLTRLPRTFRNQGYYFLFSKRLSGSAERARPYVLIDHLRVDKDDPYLPTATNENAWATGVRYDFTRRFTAKGEFRSQHARDGGQQSVVGLQVGISF